MLKVDTRVKAPAGACDSHLHIFDSSVPGRSEFPAETGAEDYRALRTTLGLSRAVVVQPRAYWTDNSVLLRAIAALGPESTRGVAVVHPDISDGELRTLHEGGVRGVRFSLFSATNVVVSFDMIEPLAHRFKDLGWHIQLHCMADQIVEHREMLVRLPVPLVFDHMTRLSPAQGPSHPVFDLVRGLLNDGRAWLKLSGAYLDSKVGRDGNFRDMNTIARAWVAAAPGRLVWGSDWPHMSERQHMPRTSALLDLLGEWVQDEALRNRILVDNPAALYGFAAA